MFGSHNGRFGGFTGGSKYCVETNAGTHAPLGHRNCIALHTRAEKSVWVFNIVFPVKKSFVTTGVFLTLIFLVVALVVANRKQRELVAAAAAAEKYDLDETERQKRKNEELRKKLEAAEADIEALLGAVRSAGTAPQAVRESQPYRPPSTLRELSAELKRAEQLVKNGDHAGALSLYTALYKNGWVGTSTLSRDLIIRGMLKLSEVYPVALQNLQQTRDEAMAQISAGAGDEKLAVDVVILNKYLGDSTGTVALYNQLPASDSRRQHIAAVGADVFTNSGAYTAVVSAKPFGTMLNDFDGDVRREGNTDQQGREYVIRNTVKNIEALVGAGMTWESQVLVDKLVKFDNSQATKALINSHVNRAKAAPKS